MPIYEYSCSKCEKTIEVIRKFSDPPLEIHEDCGGTLTKLISASGFQFKGTGWYVTDYARKSGGSDKESPSGDKDSGKSSSSTATKTSSGAESGGSGKASSSGKTGDS